MIRRLNFHETKMERLRWWGVGRRPDAGSQADDVALRKKWNSRVGKGISAQASHRTVLEILTSHGSSHSA